MLFHLFICKDYFQRQMQFKKPRSLKLRDDSAGLHFLGRQVFALCKRFCLQWIAQSGKTTSIPVGQAFQEHLCTVVVRHSQTAFQTTQKVRYCIASLLLTESIMRTRSCRKFPRVKFHSTEKGYLSLFSIYLGERGPEKKIVKWIPAPRSCAKCLGHWCYQFAN